VTPPTEGSAGDRQWMELLQTQRETAKALSDTAVALGSNGGKMDGIASELSAQTQLLREFPDKIEEAAEKRGVIFSDKIISHVDLRLAKDGLWVKVLLGIIGLGTLLGPAIAEIVRNAKH
jgi:hypothetical protein